MGEHCCRQYHEVLDIGIASIIKWFDQPGYTMYKDFESLIMQAAYGQEFDEQLDNVTTFYKADFDQALLST